MTTKILLAVLAIALVALFVQCGRVTQADLRASLAEAANATAQADLNAAEQDLANLRAARQAEQQQGEQLATIGVDHEHDRDEAEGVPAAVVAELRAGQRRLRQHWAACETARLSEAAAGAVERDAAAQRREADIGDLVRVGRDADDQLRACQAVVRADRGEFSNDAELRKRGTATRVTEHLTRGDGAAAR